MASANRFAFSDNRMSRAELKVASVNGTAINFVSQALKFLMQFCYQILVARLLLPEDFGIVAMAAPLFAFAALFSDFGLTQATVQRDEINQEQLSFVFWVNVGLSAAICLTVIALAPVAGVFFREPRIVPIVVGLSATFVIGGLCAQHLALLNRQLLFAKIALVELVSFLAGSATCLLFAWNGFGYWALVYSQIATALTTLLLAWWFAKWVPSRPALRSQNFHLLNFGANITSFNFLNFFARNFDNILIGRYLGEMPLGIYDRAYKLLLLPLSQITTPIAKVALPSLARTLSEPGTYRRFYFRMLELTILATYPAVIFAIINSQLLILTLLGPRWSEVSEVFSILAFGAIFAPISSSTGWLFISQDRTKEMRNWGALSSALFVASFVCGLPWGISGVAAFYIGVGTIQGPILWWGATRRGPLSFKQMLEVLWPYFVSAIMTSVMLYGLKASLPGTFIALLLSLVASYVIFLAVVMAFSSSRKGIIELAFEASVMGGRFYRKFAL
ncbi:lipopolysaccharide biosynthesis protein [Mesorhizobium hawassense]|uniref:Lipopolysaccharide biosynthesis protein n=2 Tax=Mesorhizobium hawassense TaxID=1209954 RepID=A0A330HKS2_9HYPH|nr:lipopolysaccharide biosynthesis protein [Mesorhizobium hawassense]